jgi:hypothetical protein
MDDESISRARWNVLERRLQRLEQATGLSKSFSNNPKEGGEPVARTPQEVDEVLQRLEQEQTNHRGALIMQMAVNAQTTRRFEQIVNLLDQYNIRLRANEDRTDANCERLDRAEQRIGRLSNPLFTLLVGTVALAGWLVLSFWLRSYLGDSVKVWMDAKEILWRDHPNFDDITGRIIGGGVAFIVGMTLICWVIDMISNASSRRRRQQQNPPPVVPVDDLDGEGGDEPEPTQVMPQPVNAGQQGL